MREIPRFQTCSAGKAAVARPLVINIGLDIGNVSLKMAALGGPDDAGVLEELLGTGRTFRPLPAGLSERVPGPVVLSDYRRIHGSPMQAVFDLLKEFYETVPESRVEGIRVTGGASRLIAKVLGIYFENEFKAIARSVATFYPQVRTVFEIGGENSKYLLLDPAAGVERFGIVDYGSSGECAAGTGSFLDQQARRLQYQVEEIGEVASCASCAAPIAGRCSVFARSDMIHAQQKGYSPEEILRGLCVAVARNFKSSIVKGKRVVPLVALMGGVSQNRGVREALCEVFRLSREELIVAELHAWLGALGAAMLEQQEWRKRSFKSIHQLQQHTGEKKSVGSQPLTLENVVLLREQVEPYCLPAGTGRIPAYLGIDVGSVSTNLALLDDDGQVMHAIYLRTVGRPIEIVHQGLQEIARLLGHRINIAGAGTTGSGRELIGELVGADTVNDEITAHKAGALFVGQRMVGESVDTIFEIGGQDSKFIALENGVVVDFAMNEACAAGTGSFLEEQAEQLGIGIEGEFAVLALQSQAPARLGERCTVFMERDIARALQNGSEKRDVVAGLAYSIALNYLNRVVRRRKIGDVIYFQGGTAYNDAVAAAFSQLLGKRIVVPPYNGVMGAIGVALIAREWARATQRPSRFRGYDLGRAQFQKREFVCQACSNYCDMKEFTIDGQKTYWGDKCSDKFRKRAKTDRQPVIEDLIAFRERALRESYEGPRGWGPRVGIPRAMYYYEHFPFWHRYLSELGLAVVVSGATDRQTAAHGVELSVAEPCYPVQIAHGHVKNLLEMGVEYVLLPNVVDSEAPVSRVPSYLCPWNQTLPFVLRAAPQLAERKRKFLIPNLYFRQGPRDIKKQLAECFARLGVTRKRSDAAVEAAYAAQAQFQQRLLAAGQAAQAALERSSEPAILLVGRPYNLYDPTVNCDLLGKLRKLYGVNLLPLDFLPVDADPVNDLHPNMYWNSGRRILGAGRLARQHPNWHVIYLTNFKCGPDSFIKFFLRQVAGTPFLVLQFDGHGNDAGYLTRCEAYLDSKGILRCYASTSVQ
jgi:predicted CoA-substrate-specific enzyme activase